MDPVRVALAWLSQPIDAGLWTDEISAQAAIIKHREWLNAKLPEDIRNMFQDVATACDQWLGLEPQPPRLFGSPIRGFRHPLSGDWTALEISDADVNTLTDKWRDSVNDLIGDWGRVLEFFRGLYLTGNIAPPGLPRAIADHWALIPANASTPYYTFWQRQGVAAALAAVDFKPALFSFRLGGVQQAIDVAGRPPIFTPRVCSIPICRGKRLKPFVRSFARSRWYFRTSRSRNSSD